MSKGFGIHGSTTSHGGTVISTQSRSSQMGNLFLRAGDGFACPKCKAWSTLIKSNDHVIFDGKAVAYVGDKFTCGATLMPKQVHVVGTSGDSPINLSVSNFQTTSEQNNSLVNNFSGNKEKYENYYIERDKTDYVKFKTGLPPYDDDKKSLIGTVMQVVSGSCDFIIHYILKDRNLFITVSYIPPVAAKDANKIFPFADLHLYKESNRNFELLSKQRLKIDDGVWNTDRGKEPVGFCNITLPKPDLSLLKIKLNLGYSLEFDGGVVFPIPSFTSHTFTLNSVAREIK